MDIKPFVLAVRSVGAEFARHLYLPVAITIGVAAVVLLALSIWLVTINLWWLILLLLLFVLIIFTVAVLVVAMVVINTVAPVQSKTQKQQTKALVDKLLRVAEVTGTPKVVLFYQVVKDIIRPSQKGFIASVSGDTASLQRDFIALKDSFK